MIEKASLFHVGHAKKHYDHLASNYEGMFERIGYPDPERVADMALK